MKKYILMLIVLTFTLSLFSLQTVRVTVHSNAVANGTVLVSDESLNVIASNNAAHFIEGSTDFDFEIADSYDPTTLYADAYGGTSWGDWYETGYILGFYGNPPTCHLNMYFEIPVDISVFVYSNIEIDNASIELQDQWQSYGTANENLKKGWTDIHFDQVWGEMFDVTTCYAEATAEGAGNESYTLTTTNDFVYNTETERYENYDIEFCFENKTLHSDWNWESIPKLTVNGTTNNSDTDMPTLLTANIVPGDYSWLNVLGRDENLEYENSTWTPTTYSIRSSEGFKIQIQEPERVYMANGTRVLESTQIDLQAGWNWIGYWLPHSEMSNVAFGDDWSKISKMKSEDWYYYNKTPVRGGFPGVNDPVTWRPKPLHYGEGYMVYLSEPINGFFWHISVERSENFNKPVSDNFTYEKKADYEVIDVVNIDPSISEIGVFVDGVCVGAVVAQDSSEQILVYSDNTNRDPVPFDFEIIIGRSSSFPIKNYEVYNFETSEFENGIIISGYQDYSLIVFGEEDEQEEDIPSITKLYSNYPNPFNPTTTISFSLPKEEDIELTIYNIKGQKVKTLYSGISEEGKHSVIWNGIDSNGKTVSSGIYFYKLKTESKELTRKMLLLK
jgi:hypothetical protein